MLVANLIIRKQERLRNRTTNCPDLVVRRQDGWLKLVGHISSQNQPHTPS